MNTVIEQYRHVTIPADLKELSGKAIIAYMGDVRASGYRIPSKAVIQFCIPDNVKLPSPLKVIASGSYDTVIFDGFVLPSDRVSYDCSPVHSTQCAVNHDGRHTAPCEVQS